jgi:hypothetical protein
MAMNVEQGARRPVIFTSSSKFLPSNFGIDENAKHFKSLADKIKCKKHQKLFLKFLMERDISNFNSKKIIKSDLQESLEENSHSPLVGYLTKIVNEKPDCVFRKSTVEALNDFNDYMMSNKLKYDYTQKKFNIELENTYNVRKGKTGTCYFEFNTTFLKEMLKTKYKIGFGIPEVVEVVTDPLDYGVLQTDLATQIDYKSKYENQLIEMQEMKNQIEELKRQSQMIKIVEPEIIVKEKKSSKKIVVKKFLKNKSGPLYETQETKQLNDNQFMSEILDC